MKILSPKLYFPKISSLIVLSIMILSFGFSIAAALPALAAGPNQPGNLGSELNQQSNAFINQTGLGKPSLSFVIAQIIKAVLAFLGLIFVVLVIYAGFLWLTSAGSEDKIDQAKKIMTAGVIGLVIILSAYAITVFVIEKLLAATVEQRSTFVTW